MIFRTLRFRVPVSIVGLGLFSAMVIGAIGWTMARDGLTNAASDRLTLAAESRRTSLELVADKLSGDMLNLAGQKEITTNIMDLSETLAQPAEDAAKNLSYFSSPPEDERIQLDGAMSGTMYGIRHSKVHAIARQLMTQGGYEDVMLIDGNDRASSTPPARAPISASKSEFPEPQTHN